MRYDTRSIEIKCKEKSAHSLEVNNSNRKQIKIKKKNNHEMIVRRTSARKKKQQIRKGISKKKIEDWAKPSVLWFLLYSRILGAWKSNSICVHVQSPIKFAVKLIQLEILCKTKRNKCIIRLNRIGGQKKMTKFASNEIQQMIFNKKNVPKDIGRRYSDDATMNSTAKPYSSFLKENWTKINKIK